MQHPGRESRHRRLFGETLLRSLTRFDKKGGLRLVRLWPEWAEVVGPEVAELAQPLGHREGTLILHTQDAIAAQELTYFVPEILSRVNGFLGQEVFDKVRFELLGGRVPLGESQKEGPKAPPQRLKRPSSLGGLVGKLDPDSSVGRCYLAYVKWFTEGAAPSAAPSADENANTRPNRASRRRK